MVSAVAARLRQGSRDMRGPGLTGPSRPPKGKGKLRDAALVCVLVLLLLFSGKSLIQKQYSRFSLFSQCQSDLLCQIT